MKEIKLILIFISSTINVCYTQNKCEWNLLNFDRLEIINGLTVYGTNSLKLTEEGLLCRNEHTKNSTCFFPWIKLNRDYLNNLQCYLMKNSFFSKDTVIDDTNIQIMTRMPVRVIIRKGWGDFVKIKYVDNAKQYDVKLDSLIILANQLIPRKYKKYYSIKEFSSR